jgi:hypothetical protein
MSYLTEFSRTQFVLAGVLLADGMVVMLNAEWLHETGPSWKRGVVCVKRNEWFLRIPWRKGTDGLLISLMDGMEMEWPKVAVEGMETNPNLG